MTPGAEIEPGPHWWKESALTTRPTLPPEMQTWGTFELTCDTLLLLKLDPFPPSKKGTILRLSTTT